MDKNDILIAADSGQIIVDGERYVVIKDKTRVRAGHPLVKGNEDMFKPIDVHYDVEQATRAPGEKRSGRRRTPSKKTAAKKAAAPSAPPKKGDD